MCPTIRDSIKQTARFLWEWGPFVRNSSKPTDTVYFGLWNVSRDEASIRALLAAEYSHIPEAELPTTEEEIRTWLRGSGVFPQTSGAGADAQPMIEQQEHGQAKSEECLECVPERVRYLLAALNAESLIVKMNAISEKPYHPKQGHSRIRRARNGVIKSFTMWREGFKAGVSRTERVAIPMFFWFLLFCNIFPNVAAGFLGERSYNVRQTGVRIVTFIQWCYLWSFPYTTFWLLFNWSLERLIGALLGNTGYGLAAAIPAVRHVYYTSWFKNMLLGLSTTWQVVIQFCFPVRDYIVRSITRQQMRTFRKKATNIDWAEVDVEVKHELMTRNAFALQHQASGSPVLDAEDVPLRVRVERLLQFSNTFKLGRPADMLVSLMKDDIENLVNVYEDYRASSPDISKAEKKDTGHVEPRAAKWLLVFFDIGIFAYISYSFFFQPFNFNTVVAYGAVVILKQTILALKRYQTVEAARRLFTNMTAFNVWGIFLVSVPVTINRDIMSNDRIFAGLFVGMVFATVFLTEPLAPLFQIASEKTAAKVSVLYGACKKSPSSTSTDANRAPSLESDDSAAENGEVEKVDEKSDAKIRD